MFELSEYQNDRAAAVLNIDPADIRARKSADGMIMVYATTSTAVGFGVTEAFAVDSLETDARRGPHARVAGAPIEPLVSFRGAR